MKRVLQIAVIVLLSVTNLAAQEKKKTLTMDDVAPAAPNRSSVEGPEPRSEEERNWQKRMNDAEIGVLSSQLHSAIDEHNPDLKIDLKKKQDEAAELRAEGQKRKFQARRSLDLDYRERYVKLRLEMIKEEKEHPEAKKSQRQRLYVESRRSRTRRRYGERRINAPVLDTKETETPPSKLEKLEEQLEDLAEEGRRAGASPGMFRD